MKLVLKTITPRSDEAIWYLFFGGLFLLLINSKEILAVLLAISQTDVTIQAAIDDSLIELVRNTTQPLNGRLGNSVIWAFMGLLAFTLGSVAVSEVQDLFDHSEAAKRIPGRYRGSVWLEFIARTAIRTTALFALIIWVYVWLVYINPAVSRMLLESMLAPQAYVWGLLAFIFGTVVFALSGHIFAVFCRFVALRVRVFSNEI